MASTARDNRKDGVEFIHEDDGRVTAKDIETGVASFGDDRAEALRMLADALDAYHGKGVPVDESDLAAELGLGENELGSEGRRGTSNVGRTTFTGREVAKVLMKFGYEPKSRTGSHLTLEYVNPDTGEVRRPTVPLHGEIPRGTLGSIAEQCGAEDFHSFCEWIDDFC
jgi:predicted RNA binding protein YcfA (HicA-like mRNA interferase family)